MSYKLSLFAFPSRVSDDAILGELSLGVETVAADVSMGDAFIVLREIDAMKFAWILAQGRSPGSGVRRGTLTDGFFGKNYPMAFLGYDDQNGVSLFEGNGTLALRLLSDGCFIGGRKLPDVKVDFPQKGFTNDELRALHDKPESELSDREHAAIAEYQSAIDIGLRESFGWQSGRKFLDVCQAREAFPVGGSKPVTLPSGAVQLVAFWPEDPDWMSAGLPPRVY